MDPADAQRLSKCLLTDRQRVVGGMRQSQDGLDLVVPGDASHRPVLLPGSAVNLPRLHDGEFPGKNIVVAVPPELLGSQEYKENQQAAASPEFSSSHPADLPTFKIQRLWLHPGRGDLVRTRRVKAA